MLHPFLLRTVPPLGRFGKRVHPRTGRRSVHRAIDYRVPEGSTVRPVADGVVTDVAYSAVWGWEITVAHLDGWASRYCHLRDEPDTPVGRHVTTRDHIGRVGQTGTSAHGPHLHLELYHHGYPVNPESHLTERNTP